MKTITHYEQSKYTPVPISIQQVNIINSKHDKELLNTETNVNLVI